MIFPLCPLCEFGGQSKWHVPLRRFPGAAGSPITSVLGVIAKTFPVSKVHSVLAATGKTSMRQRDLPAHVVVYYVIALALYMQSSYREVLRCLLEGMQWLHRPVGDGQGGGQVGHFASAHAARMGAGASTARRGGAADRGRDDPGRLVSGNGAWSAWTAARWMSPTSRPMMRPSVGPAPAAAAAPFRKSALSSLVENGTHVLFGSQMAGYGTGEITLAKAVLANLRPGMLCLADRQFFGFELWNQAAPPGRSAVADQEERCVLPRDKRLARRLLSEPHLPHPRKIGGTRPTACRCASSTIAWTASPMPSRSTGSSPPFSITGKAPAARVGGALSRALGNRNRAGRTQDPSARRQDRLAQQDP